MVYGAWLIYKPAGWIIGGGLSLFVSMLIDKQNEPR